MSCELAETAVHIIMQKAAEALQSHQGFVMVVT